MRIPIFSIALPLLAGFAPLLHAQGDSKSAAAAPAVELVFELADGSRVIGMPSFDRLEIKNENATLNFELSKSRAIEFSGANHAAEVDFQNGDVLKGQLAATEIAVKTDSGEVTVPVAKVSRILVRVGSVGGNFFVNSLGMEFITVPGTKVLFGIWDTRVKDFEVFVTATGYDATAGMGMVPPADDGGRQHNETWKTPGFTQSATHPVVMVSWKDAKAFCKWLTGKERKEGKIGPDQEYRLPTDLEWSAAVGLPREGGDTPAERSKKIAGVYPWGKEWPPPKGAGNYAPSLKVDDFEHTSPVGSFAANQYGLYDMGGNVWQWCEDWYDSKHAGRALRGAAWDFYNPDCLLSSYRLDGRTPDSRYVDCGFRVVLTAESLR